VPLQAQAGGAQAQQEAPSRAQAQAQLAGIARELGGMRMQEQALEVQRQALQEAHASQVKRLIAEATTLALQMGMPPEQIAAFLSGQQVRCVVHCILGQRPEAAAVAAGAVLVLVRPPLQLLLRACQPDSLVRQSSHYQCKPPGIDIQLIRDALTCFRLD
jgi:hypothetical protein